MKNHQNERDRKLAQVLLTSSHGKNLKSMKLCSFCWYRESQLLKTDDDTCFAKG